MPNIFHRDIEFSTQINTSNNLPPTPYKKLAHDKTVKMLYEIKHLEEDTNKIILLILFVNRTESLIKELIFNVIDTATLQLERRVRVIL